MSDFTTDDLAAINRAIASGHLSVSISGRTVTFRSMEELRAARDLIRQDLKVTSGRDRRYLEYNGKGL